MGTRGSALADRMDHSMHSMDMHSGHGDMDMGPQCKMNMLFTWSYEDLCIVSRSWHVSGPWSLVVSMLAIVALTAGYEAVRQAASSYELRHLRAGKDALLGTSDLRAGYQDDARAADDSDSTGPAAAGLPSPRGGTDEERQVQGADALLAADAETNGSPTACSAASTARAGAVTERERRKARVTMAAFYAAQVFYSFFIMLLFMTYNGWVMLSVAVGAFLGYLSFGSGSATRAVACH